MESDPGSGLRMTEPHAGEHARRPSPRGAPHSPFRQSTVSHLVLPGRIDACEFFCAVRASRFLRLLPLLRCPCSAPGSVRQSRSIASTDNSGIRLLTPARRRGRRRTVLPASTGTRYPMCAGRWDNSSPPLRGPGGQKYDGVDYGGSDSAVAGKHCPCGNSASVWSIWLTFRRKACHPSQSLWSRSPARVRSEDLVRVCAPPPTIGL